MSAAIALMGVSTAMQGYSAYQQVKAQNKANAFNASLMERNQVIAEEQALFAGEKGAKDEADFRLRLDSLKGQQRAAFSSSGVVVGEGSAGLVLQDTAEFGELDAMTIRRNTEFEVFDARSRATQFGAQARQLRDSNKNAKLAAATAILGGGSQIAGASARR